MVRNLLIVIGTVGALCMGSPSHAGSANVSQSSTTQNPPSAAGVFFDEADLKNDKGNQTLLSFPTPTGGQISFRTKTRNGIRGMLPKPPKLRLWRRKPREEGLDTTKRFLHITNTALVLEIEGEDECLSIDRGPESANGGARVTVIRREEAGVSRGSPGYIMTVSVDGLFGVYDLLSGPFLAVIRRSKLRYANPQLGVEFRQVSKVRLIPVLAAPRALDEAEAREEARLLSLLALAFRSHQLYFSHVYDVTQTLQNLGVSTSTPATSPPPSPLADGPRREKTRSSSSYGGRRGGNAGESAKGSKYTKKETKKKHHNSHGRKEEGNGDARSEGWRGRSTATTMTKGARRRAFPPAMGGGGTAQKSSPLRPRSADARFFWNLGVLGALLDLRDRVKRRREICVETGAVSWAEAGRGGGQGTEEAGAEAAAVDRWLTPVMSGFLQVERGCRVGDRGFDVLFVSRRSRLRQGTRFTRRGVDDGGNVANFVETEQALLYDDHSVTSHVQIRGSIPVLWSSPTNLRYRPKVRIDPDQEASLRALRRHTEDLMRLYAERGGGIVFINLVDKTKDQGQLGEAFDAALEAVANGAGRELSPYDRAEGEKNTPAKGEESDLAGSLRHVWFDFHHECRNMHWENLDKLLAIVDREFGEQGFYHAGPEGEVLSVQDGVVRTNCMDCLDRTNVVQSLLARRSMLIQLRAVGAEMPEPQGGNSTALALTLDMLEMPAEELERRFRDVWGNNADEISMLYAGTPALKGDFTRTGQRTKLGLLQDGTNSAIRYVVNNFQDHRRQEAVDVLLGLRRPSLDPDGNISSALLKEPLDLDRWTTRLAATSAAAAAAAAALSEKYGESGSSPVGSAATRSSIATTPPNPAARPRCSQSGAVDAEGCEATEAFPPLPSGSRINEVAGSGRAEGAQRRRGREGGEGKEDVDAERGTGADQEIWMPEAAAVIADGVDGAGAMTGAVEGRAAGTAFAELRMAGPYSALALTALLFMAVSGGDLLAIGGGGSAARVTTFLLLAGLASLPIVLPLLEAR